MAVSAEYNAEAIEVLTGLDPVRKRPGMYTDTTRPNHLAQEVIDNSVDEALAGFARSIDVVLHADGSLSVTDDGRGMPVDIHPEQGKPGVEVILCTLHAGGKFSDGSYQFSGGLHGVGVSVVNALSLQLEVTVRRDGNVHRMRFASGNKASELEIIDTVARRSTGTTVRFRPDPRYFDTVKFSVSRLTHLLRAKAVLCPGLNITFTDEATGQREAWYYENGLPDYIRGATAEYPTLPAEPFVGSFSGKTEAVDWAVQWLPEGGELITESYVNLIPTAQGGTHVNGLRTGLLEALREYCEFRSLLPRGIKLERRGPVGPLRLRAVGQAARAAVQRPDQGAPVLARGGRVHRRGRARRVLAVARTAHRGRRQARRDGGFGGRGAAAQEPPGRAQEDHLGTGAAGQARRLLGAGSRSHRTVPGRGRLGGRLGQAGARSRVPGDHAAQGQDPELLGAGERRDPRLGGDPQHRRRARRRSGLARSRGTALRQGLHPGRRRQRRAAHRDAAVRAVRAPFPPAGRGGRVFVAMPPLYRIDIGKDVYYALDESEKEGVLNLIEAEKKKGKVNVQRFKGLGEMNPLQLRETVMTPDTRRLVELTLSEEDQADQLLDMLLAKKRATDRRDWLERSGNLAERM